MSTQSVPAAHQTDENPVANNDKVMQQVDGEPGYFVGKMSEHDLSVLTSLIKEQYVQRILSEAPDYSRSAYGNEMNVYHRVCEGIDHRHLWSKRARILGPAGVEQVKNLAFFAFLKAQLGNISITGEDGSGWEEVYWRIVRPGTSDLGDLHADKWFWDLGHGEIPENTRRIKIWIAIDTVPGKSGLRLIPGSHLKKDWKYHGEVDHTGKAKPKFDENPESLDIVNVSTTKGQYIVFHDELIHAGMPNLADKTRISLEATLIVPLNT